MKNVWKEYVIIVKKLWVYLIVYAIVVVVLMKMKIQMYLIII
jgi:hypothetical protein